MCLCLLNALMFWMGVAKALARLLINAHTRLSFRCSRMQSIDCVSKLCMTSKCTYVLNGGSKGSGETAQMRRLVWAFRLLSHAIKTTVDCMSMSSKCTYALNGSGETAQVRRLVWAFVARTCNKNDRRLCEICQSWVFRFSVRVV